MSFTNEIIEKITELDDKQGQCRFILFRVQEGQSGGSATVGTLKEILHTLSDELKKRLVDFVTKAIDCGRQTLENVLWKIEECVSTVLTATIDFLSDVLDLVGIEN